jgi:putative ABC transport system permease protein
MIKHILRALWHRRRSEALVVVEVLATFLVIAMVAAFATMLGSRARLPLGFDADRVLRIEVVGVGDSGEQALIQSRPRILEELAAIPGVESAAGLGIAPWDGSDMTRTDDGLEMFVNSVTPEVADVLRLEPIAGRFFEEADASLPWTPVVLNQRLAHQLFGEEDPIGKVAEVGGDGQAEARVVGVLADFRENGEFSPPVNYLIELATHQGRPRATDYVVRLAPRSSADTRRVVAERLREIAPDWSFQLRELRELRERRRQQTLAPLILAAAAALFLLGTVGLGLTGVVWQNVGRRTRELALRRAIGATKPGLMRQIVLEVVILCLVGVACGALVLVQFPLLGFGSIMPTKYLLVGALLSSVIVATAGAVCALYPGRQTTRIAVAEALRQE